MSKRELHKLELSQLERMYKDWEQVFDAIRDPIFMHDKEFRIIRANQAYASRAGLGILEIIGKPYWEVFPRQDGPLPGCQELMQTPVPEETRQAYQLGNGEVYNIRSFVMADEKNNYLYSVHIMEEIQDPATVECATILEQLHTTFSNTVKAIASAAEARDPYTAGHQRRVAHFATVLGKELGLSGHQLEGIHLASLVHDIGKLHVPTELLTKPRQLEHAEYELVKSHAGVGNMILSSIDF
ncbi:MAG: PAS domain-containing protein, partial [Granulosicoccaceae bacterium]